MGDNNMLGGMNPVALGLMGAKMVGGAIQAFQGRKILKNTKLPDYNIASEYGDNIGLAKSIKNMGGMPQTQYTQALQNMFRNANFGMSQLQGRRGAVAGVGNMVQRLNDGSTNLAVADANMALQNRRIGTGMQMNANNSMAQQKQAKQSWEKFNPYLRKLNEGQALVGAGMQNMFGAASDATSMAMYDQYFKKQ
jgi:hypothetical protein